MYSSLVCSRIFHLSVAVLFKSLWLYSSLVCSCICNHLSIAIFFTRLELYCLLVCCKFFTCSWQFSSRGCNGKNRRNWTQCNVRIVIAETMMKGIKDWESEARKWRRRLTFPNFRSCYCFISSSFVIQSSFIISQSHIMLSSEPSHARGLALFCFLFLLLSVCLFCFGWVLAGCCFTSTETVGLLGTGTQNGHLDLHTAPELRPALWWVDA